MPRIEAAPRVVSLPRAAAREAELAPQATPIEPVVGAGIQLQGISKQFGQREVLRELDLAIRPNEFVALVGRSGCGKSTLLRVIAGLESPTTGVARIDGQTFAGIHPAARMMFQDARLLPWLRVSDNVALGSRKTNSEKVDQIIGEVGLASHRREWPRVLSGGQRQRAALARALMGRPRLLLLDEPLGALDALTRIEMQGLIQAMWHEHPCTAVLVTHDIEEAVCLADRVLVLGEGRIVREFAVSLPRPRERGGSELLELSTEILDFVLR